MAAMSGTQEHVDMYCTGCEYNLHGLSSRRCPECGQEFDPSDESTYRRELKRPPRWILVAGILVGGFLAFYPVFYMVMIHLTWVVAWMELGRPPRPFLDDPKYIGGPVDAWYSITRHVGSWSNLSLLLTAVMVFAGMAYRLYWLRWQSRAWLWAILLPTGAWVATIGYTFLSMFLGWPPMPVWFFD